MQAKRYLPEIITIIADLVVVSILHFLLGRIGIQPGFELLYILVIGIFPILFYTFYKSFVVHEEINNQSRVMHERIDDQNQKLEYIRSTLDASVKSIQGEKKILTFLDELRKYSHGTFYGMWALDYEESLDVYFQKEIEEFNGRRVRLFNINSLSQKNENLEVLKHHLIDNQSQIEKGDYEVYATKFSSFELVICTQVENAKTMEFELFDNLESSNDVAIQLFINPGTNRVGLAVYSNETGWVSAMNLIFKYNKKNENRLKAVKNTKFEDCIDSWLNKHRT
jgi:hypothetical protein